MMESALALSQKTVTDTEQGFWIFGYGSLIWRPSFPFIKRINGFIKNYSRRFWQGSTDHRGVPGNPGRVVTLIPANELPEQERSEIITWGVAYLVSHEKRSEVLDYLDYREKGGYTQTIADVYTNQDDKVPAATGALLYLANTSNVNYLGAAPMEEIAKKILVSVGPSGTNKEYLYQLAEALRNMGVNDSHVEELDRMVKQLEENTKSRLLEEKET